MPAPAPLPIEEGSIVQAKVSRLEAYGAFCELLLSQTQTLRFNLRGLIHISQLANFKVDKVDDVVSLEDIVWVKVIQLETLEGDNGRPRYKIGLSMKQVSQENGRDTDASRQQQEASLASQQIQRHLSSSIGMGVALDPMASQHLALNNNRNLILKHQAKQETVINGYALVPAEEEDEHEEKLVQAKVEEPKVSAAATRNTGASTVGQARGRGRGMTLPAWMTHQSAPAEGPVQTSSSLEIKDNEKDKDDPSENKKNESNNRKRHKESKHDKKKRRRHDHSESSSDDESEERDRKRKRKHKHTHKHKRRKHDHHRKRDRKRREHDSEEEDSRSTTSSRSDDSSRDHRTKRQHQDDGKRRRRRTRSRSHSPPSTDNNGKHSRTEFQSIQEAQRIIEQIQAKKDNQRRDKQRAN